MTKTPTIKEMNINQSLDNVGFESGILIPNSDWKTIENIPISISIHATINKVMTDLAKLGIAKNRKNVLQNYQYRGIDDLYDTVASLYAKHGLIIYPQVLEYKHESRPTKTGAANYVMQQVKFIFAHTHNDQTFESIVWGEALDNSDKATNKALTSAYKYMAIMTFSIPINGVDNDPDNGSPELAPIVPDKQLKQDYFNLKLSQLKKSKKSKLPILSAEQITWIDKQLLSTDIKQIELAITKLEGIK